ncbi:MAG TPA: tRNA 2-thiouridine(34) synthase MnmA [Actinomycetota bacterium]
MVRVLMAMSGGVDSSVAACLLHEAGHEVLGSHLKLVDGTSTDHGCCGPQAEADARAVARHAGFDFETPDFREVFAERVLTDFLAEHEAGRTPNPCIRCNQHVKFGAFLARAEQVGADLVATGHYVRTARGSDGRWRLLRGRDRSKDQSYMVHTLGQRELSRALFPVGGQTKAETRAHARRLGLPVADKPDSQELCFAPSGDAGAFLSAHAPHLSREGEVVDPSGRVLGGHAGAARYTIGQRRGLGVSTGERAYVVEVDVAANRVVVGPGELLARRGLEATGVTWVSGVVPDGPLETLVKIRYRGEAVPAVVEAAGGGARVAFGSPQRSVVPGQSVVFYRSDEVLGGGVIASSW